MPHDELGVDQDISAEDECGASTIDQFNGAAVREESGHEPENDEDPQRAKEVGHPTCKVVLGLASEEGQGDEDAEGDDERFNDNARLVEGRDDTDGVCLEQSEGAEEDEICWIALPLPVSEEHEADGAEERDPHHPAVGLNPAPVRDGEEGDGGEDGSEQELDGENRVDFADEGHANVDGRFRDGATKLYSICETCGRRREWEATYLEVIRNIVVFTSRRTQEAIVGAGILI